jgi:hypothetical protein
MQRRSHKHSQLISILIISILLIFFHYSGNAVAASAERPKRVCNLVQKQCFASLFEAVQRMRHGDTLELQPGRYVRDFALLRVSHATIRKAHGSNGAVVLDAAGGSLFNKGILIVQGNNNTIDGLSFTGARAPHRNGAGIRHEGGDLTVKNSRFDNNEMGLLAGDHPSGHIQIIDSEFARSNRIEDVKFPLRGYPSHNIYVGRYAKLSLRGVWSHSVDLGHPLKSRARENDIEASYLSSRVGTGSYEAEFPSGGNLRFVGNIVEQGEHSDNVRMLTAGLEVARTPNAAATHAVTLIQNTFINHNALRGDMLDIRASALFAPTVRLSDNVWHGPGSPRDADNARVLASQFEAFDRCDFRLRASDASELPAKASAAQFEYVHPAKHMPRRLATIGALSPGGASKGFCAP